MKYPIFVKRIIRKERGFWSESVLNIVNEKLNVKKLNRLVEALKVFEKLNKIIIAFVI